MKKIIFASTALISIIFLSCNKGPGEGGKATITGKIWILNYKTTNAVATLPKGGFYALESQYYGQDENVYIVYGDAQGVSNSVKSDYKGRFTFNYLRPGKYIVYALTRDTSYFPINGSGSNYNKKVGVLVNVEINSKKQVLTMDSIIIMK